MKVCPVNDDDKNRGYLNGIKSAITLDRGKDSKQRRTREQVIVGHNPLQAFAQPGDSGTWVMMEADATVAGMVIAGTLKPPFLTYVSDLPEVFEDIKCQLNLKECHLI